MFGKKQYSAGIAEEKKQRRVSRVSELFVKSEFFLSGLMASQSGPRGGAFGLLMFMLRVPPTPAKAC